MSPLSRLSRTALACLIVGGMTLWMLVAPGSPLAGAAASNAGELLVETPSGQVPLAGSTQRQTRLTVSWSLLDEPASKFARPSFELDGQPVADPSVSVLSSTYDGTSSSDGVRANRLTLDVTAGAHVLRGTLQRKNGSTVQVQASFVVDLGGGTTTTTAPTTTAPTTTTTAPTTTTTAPTTTSTTTTTAPPPPPTTLRSVRDYGARGDGSTDDTAAIRRAVAAAADEAGGVHFPIGTYKLTSTVDLPDGLRTVDLAAGAVVRQFGNASAFQKVGDVATRQYGVVEARGGSRTIQVDSTIGLAVGDWFYFGSDDLLYDAKGYRRGFLRRIVGISGSTLTVDAPLHRSLSNAPRGWEVSLTPGVEFRGGAIEQADPARAFQPLLHLELVSNPRVIGTELRQCGAAGIKTLGTVGGLVDTFIHDCLDDENGSRYGSGRHYGYGVEVTGPSRDLIVRGTATRVRHAFTTNGAYGPRSDSRLLLIGEPEDLVVSMDVWETTSSGLDTHEPGWNIHFKDCSVRDAGVYKRQGSTNGNEGGFGFFIRARGTIVENCTVERSAEDGLVVATPASGATVWPAADGPVIRDVRITGTEGKRGMHFYQPAHAERVRISGHHLVGLHLNSQGAGSTGRSVYIDLQNYADSFGVVDPEYVTLTDLTIVNARRQFG